MQEITRCGWLKNQNQLTSKNENPARPHTSILLGLVGGVLSAMLGFFLLAINSLTGNGNASENYGGVALLILAFICFGVSSHFMDKADASKSVYKRTTIERFNKNNSAG